MLSSFRAILKYWNEAFEKILYPWMARLIAAKKVILSSIIIILLIFVNYAIVFSDEHGQASKSSVNIACVGDSITEWSGYTEDLQKILGDKFTVGNFGVAGAAVSKSWFKPYIKQVEFKQSKEFQPSLVVIMLGTNDAHTHQSVSEFSTDYRSLVSEYQGLVSKPKILLVKPPPIYENELELSDDNLQEKIIPAIDEVADELDLHVVDVNFALSDHPEYFEDGVHPNQYGATAIAEKISEAINADLTISVETLEEFFSAS